MNSQTQQGQNEQSCSESLILDSHYDIFATSTLLESQGQQLLNEPNRIEIDIFDSDNKLFASSTSQRQQGLNESSREPVVYESDYDLFASSPVSDPPDRMWEKYCDPNKGDYNVQQFSVGDTCSEIA